jgi:predicted choloylglycine hydrolase
MKSVAALVLLLQLALATPTGDGPGQGAALDFEERLAAGGPGDFMLVKHLTLRGSNLDIGRKLAEIAQQEHGVNLTPLSAADRLKLRVLRNYMARNFPVHYERMCGVAAFYGATPESDAVDFSGLFYDIGAGAGCSVVFYPPQFTASGRGVLSRNYDFTTGTLDGRAPPPGQPAATSRPYVLELYPERGYASLAICAYDLVGGAIDGINSEGLCVALLADDESASTQPIEPAMGTEVGLYELNIPRFLLDTCADSEQAKEMLLSAKHYYSFMPLHYIVADRHGNSFVWEYSYSSNKEYVVEGGGAPQVVTNHPLYKWKKTDELPVQNARIDSYERYQNLTGKIAASTRKCSLEFIKETNRSVAADDAGPPAAGRARHRTLWHALYYPENRKAEVDFYLRDEPDPRQPGQNRIVRSGYVEFQLDSPR